MTTYVCTQKRYQVRTHQNHSSVIVYCTSLKFKKDTTASYVLVLMPIIEFITIYALYIFTFKSFYCLFAIGEHINPVIENVYRTPIIPV
jgi:hypothetical protein